MAKKAINIAWDVDREEDLQELPTEIELPEGMTDGEEISDYISEKTGFCHRGFEVVDRTLVWIVVEHKNQNEYTEPHYYSSAADASEIKGVFATRAKAEAEKARLEALADGKADDPDANYFYCTVASYTVN